MHRKIAALLVALFLLPTVWLGGPLPPANSDASLTFTPVALPPAGELERLGAFRLERIWKVDSPNTFFGGYSALLPADHGGLMAFNDFGKALEFQPPTHSADPRRRQQGRFVELPAPAGSSNLNRDTEAATMDPATGIVWQAVESTNAIDRLSPDLRQLQRVQPRVIKGWGSNNGPESLLRLRDGRFVTVRESTKGTTKSRLHQAVIFAGDPLTNPHGKRFTFDGPAGFSVTDMAQMPDGRVLILLRRLIWPVHPSFASRLAIADPANIRPDGVWRATEVARIASTMPIDNFEGIAVVPRADGRLTVWIISDDNRGDWQKTILWDLSVDPTALP